MIGIVAWNENGGEPLSVAHSVSERSEDMGIRITKRSHADFAVGHLLDGLRNAVGHVVGKLLVRIEMNSAEANQRNSRRVAELDLRSHQFRSMAVIGSSPRPSSAYCCCRSTD